jgi:heat shock protein HslJ
MRIVLLATCLAFLSACNSLTESATLDGTAWQLTGWVAPGNPAAFAIDASFAEGRMAGKSAVNRYFAAYTLGPGNRFSALRAGSTRMAGSPEAMAAERTHFELLEAVKTYRRDAEVLVLADAAGQPLLTFTAVP